MRTKRYAVLCALLAATVLGCRTARAAEVDDVYGTEDLLAQPRASQKHDRVTIVINEKTTARHEAGTDTSKETEFGWSFEKLFKITKDRDGDIIALPFPDVRKPELAVETERTHEAEGETDTTSTAQTVLSGEVIDVRPNGHLIVEARSSVTIGEEERTVIFTGRVDPTTLLADNSVDAKYVMDRAVKFEGQGNISDATKRGWLAKVFDYLSPF